MMTLRTILLVGACSVLVAPAARAELLRVEIKTLGMD